jgi:hypothetical protein
MLVCLDLRPETFIQLPYFLRMPLTEKCLYKTCINHEFIIFCDLMVA